MFQFPERPQLNQVLETASSNEEALKGLLKLLISQLEDGTFAWLGNQSKWNDVLQHLKSLDSEMPDQRLIDYLRPHGGTWLGDHPQMTIVRMCQLWEQT